MDISANDVIKGSWAVLFLYWIINARFAKRAVHREGVGWRFAAYYLPLIIAFYLLGPGDHFEHSVLGYRLWPKTEIIAWSGALLVVAGVALACWSRSMLGRNWSVSVERKEGHELIRTGPYRLVRHPIYTGLLLAALGTCIAIGEVRVVISFPVILVSLVWKLQREEAVLGDEFGEQYAAYRMQTRALIPGVY